MPPKTNSIWMDGRFVPWDEAKVHVLAHGLHYGTGAFEGIRSYRTSRGPAIFRLDDHLRRFSQSASFLFMDLPYGAAELAEACKGAVLRNGLSDAYIRPLAFYGLGGMNFSFKDNAVHVAVAVWPWGAYLGEDGLRHGIRVKTASWAKTSTNAVPSGAKLAGAYVNSCLAYQEAMRAGFDEALLFNDAGAVAEGTGENLFLVRGNEVVTPPVSDHILPGVTRDSVMRLARDEGYAVREATITRPELFAADELFFTGTAAEVTPIREVDWRPIGAGRAGPVTLQLQRAFFAAVRGETAACRSWLTFLEEPVTAVDGNLRQMTGAVSANVK